jgi:hypothetical protein
MAASDSGAAYARRIKSGAFFREHARAKQVSQRDYTKPTIGPMQLKALPVLFRHSRTPKLMHKIHRLTDN